ncbi:MAG: hypothetical protein MZV64_16790 [Ignavibacteriales bacterium]|nr:hypothetical protein [Ignavibacteriales bacterium]
MAGMDRGRRCVRRAREHRRRRPARRRPRRTADALGRADGHLSRPRTASSRRRSARSAAIVHENGGQVYMDGANMNAQVGLTPARRHRRRRLPPQPAQDLLPSRTGAAARAWARSRVAAHLAPVPARPPGRADRRRRRPSAPVSAAPWGSASILLHLLGLHRA